MYNEIASNKRRSIAFIVLFFVVWLAIGALCGLIFKVAYHPTSYSGSGYSRQPTTDGVRWSSAPSSAPSLRSAASSTR